MEREEEQVKNHWVGSPKAWDLIQDIKLRGSPTALIVRAKGETTGNGNSQEPEVLWA